MAYGTIINLYKDCMVFQECVFHLLQEQAEESDDD